MNKDYIIHYEKESYHDGSNLLFSIEFLNYRTNKGYSMQTCWYNDNHEFGDDDRSRISANLLAKWYLEDIKRIYMIDSGYHDTKYFDYRDNLASFLETLIS
jgi:hypothetical protein